MTEPMTAEERAVEALAEAMRDTFRPGDDLRPHRKAAGAVWSHIDRDALRAALLADLRSPRNELGLLAPPKGRMELAVEEAWEKATSSVGDPEDGIVQHDLGALADAICDALEAVRR